MSGHCRHQEKCKFLHVFAPPVDADGAIPREFEPRRVYQQYSSAQKTLCWEFCADGVCSNGAHCPFMHRVMKKKDDDTGSVHSTGSRRGSRGGRRAQERAESDVADMFAGGIPSSLVPPVAKEEVVVPKTTPTDLVTCVMVIPPDVPSTAPLGVIRERVLQGANDQQLSLLPPVSVIAPALSNDPPQGGDDYDPTFDEWIEDEGKLGVVDDEVEMKVVYEERRFCDIFGDRNGYGFCYARDWSVLPFDLPTFKVPECTVVDQFAFVKEGVGAVPFLAISGANYEDPDEYGYYGYGVRDIFTPEGLHPCYDSWTPPEPYSPRGVESACDLDMEIEEGVTPPSFGPTLIHRASMRVALNIDIWNHLPNLFMRAITRPPLDPPNQPEVTLLDPYLVTRVVQLRTELTTPTKWDMLKNDFALILRKHGLCFGGPTVAQLTYSEWGGMMDSLRQTRVGDHVDQLALETGVTSTPIIGYTGVFLGSVYPKIALDLMFSKGSVTLNETSFRLLMAEALKLVRDKQETHLLRWDIFFNTIREVHCALYKRDMDSMADRKSAKGLGSLLGSL